MEHCELYFGDCYNYIKTMEDHSVDLLLCDPPYNIAPYSTGNIYLPGRAPVNNDIADWDKVNINPEDFADEFVRVLKPKGNIFVFVSYNMIGRWHEVFDSRFDTFQFFIWHKTNPMPKIFKNGFLNSCEMIICMWNKGHAWNFTKQNEMHNFFQCPICMRPERISDPKHPAQKPVKLLKHLVAIASQPGDLVFDPFMGTGSTGEAALSLGRRFAGCEIDKRYFCAAESRLEKYALQQDK
ncbi:DNA-methyltransferase [Youxingia wuxianensis]|uniref:Methyltransferase n=1 Tax=Youxingia wuxianensis TaxID=2763678 RepID=A0A926ES31_9FIRM|nr:site-specific DNA-methyltransferase [Youxingia wuxianensis]MBC8585250.1 site-specific DNA-methyltransferase [Youxingia wuxianensis]